MFTFWSGRAAMKWNNIEGTHTVRGCTILKVSHDTPKLRNYTSGRTIGQYWLEKFPVIEKLLQKAKSMACWIYLRSGHELNFFCLLFVKTHWFAWRANQWPLIRETPFSSVPPSSSLVSVSNHRRAFWADTTPFSGPRLASCIASGTTEIQGHSQVSRARCRGPRTPSVRQQQLTQKPWLCVCWKRTFLYRSLILKSQQNRTELVTRPDLSSLPWQNMMMASTFTDNSICPE